MAISNGVTPRELDVIKGVSDGLTSPQIGKDLNISEETVKRHLTNIFNKFGCDTRTAMLAIAYQKGIVNF